MNRQYPNIEETGKDPYPLIERIKDLFDDDFPEVLLRGILGTLILALFSFIAFGLWILVKASPMIVLGAFAILIGFFVVSIGIGLLMKKFGILF